MRSGGSHLLDRSLHRIPYNRHLSLLVEAQDATNGLALYGWVPLGLKNVYPVGYGQAIEAVSNHHASVYCKK